MALWHLLAVYIELVDDSDAVAGLGVVVAALLGRGSQDSTAV